MGNSSTARYADGRDLYHPEGDHLAWARGLPRLWGTASDGILADALADAARKLVRPAWAQTRRALRRAPPLVPLAPRRAAGEKVRLLLDPTIAPHVRKLARRHGRDEGDVTSLWAATTTAPAPPARPLGWADPEAAPA